VIDQNDWLEVRATDVLLSNASSWEGSWQATGGWAGSVHGETEDCLLMIGPAGAAGNAVTEIIGVAPNPFRESASVRSACPRHPT
jgi:hypothetical protein